MQHCGASWVAHVLRIAACGFGPCLNVYVTYFFCCMRSALYSCCAQASCMYCSLIFDTQYGMRPCVLDLNICHIMCMAFVCRRQSCTIHGRGIFWQRMCLDFSVSCKTLLVCTVLSAWRIIGTFSHEALSILGLLELAD